MKEFNLSEERLNLLDDLYGYEESKVKEFIKRLKEEHMKHTKNDYFLNIINKLAGEELE